jgi:hypothetical protein
VPGACDFYRVAVSSPGAPSFKLRVDGSVFAVSNMQLGLLRHAGVVMTALQARFLALLVFLSHEA